MTASFPMSLGQFWVFWIISTMLVSIHPPISNSPSFLSNPIGYRFKQTNFIWYHCHPHITQFPFTSLARSKYLFMCSPSFIFTVVRWNSKIHLTKSYLSILVISTRSDLLAGIRWSICISKSQRYLRIIF